MAGSEEVATSYWVVALQAVAHRVGSKGPELKTREPIYGLDGQHQFKVVHGCQVTYLLPLQSSGALMVAFPRSIPVNPGMTGVPLDS